ncbi:S-layer homology domain-containing protein [Paenibacillus foliorum]|nr:S-layer homology domain-containing protein [Paenibacillus foliorum]
MYVEIFGHVVLGNRPSHWSRSYAERLIGMGVIEGFEDIISGFPDGTFRPGAPATWAEAAAMLYRLMEALDI